MSLQLGSVAPDFTADTTMGSISFHEWLGSSWGVLFSHPRDFTPVCTTELGRLSALKSEFDKRDVKIIGLSVDPIGAHTQWSNYIKETQGHAPTSSTRSCCSSCLRTLPSIRYTIWRILAAVSE